MIASRIAAAALLLIVLAFVELVLPDEFPVLVAVLLMAVLSFQWAAAYFFTRASGKDTTIVSLRGRAQDAVLGAIGSTAGAFLGLLVVFRAVSLIGPVPRDVFLVGIAFSLLMLASPAVNALVTWRPWEA